jgi:hypothetical protein
MGDLTRISEAPLRAPAARRFSLHEVVELSADGQNPVELKY